MSARTQRRSGWRTPRSRACRPSRPPRTTFTGTNPVFSGSLTVESGTGVDHHRFETSSGDGATYALCDESGVVRGQVRIDNNADLHIDTGSGDLILDSGAALELRAVNGIRFGVGGTPIKGVFSATVIWDPDSIPAADDATKVVNVPGALVGDAVFAVNEHVQDDTNLSLSARVTASNFVTLYLANHGPGAVNPGSRTIRIVVMRF